VGVKKGANLQGAIALELGGGAGHSLLFYFNLKGQLLGFRKIDVLPPLLGPN
jgi:hypothetical protein